MVADLKLHAQRSLRMYRRDLWAAMRAKSAPVSWLLPFSHPHARPFMMSHGKISKEEQWWR